jgi:hypothetical protein
MEARICYLLTSTTAANEVQVSMNDIVDITSDATVLKIRVQGSTLYTMQNAASYYSKFYAIRIA